MDPIVDPTSLTLFGIRVDSATSKQATLAIWESAISRGGLRVVLTDIWALLMAQRDYTMWEALSAADYVLPLADDAVIRRLVQRRHMAAIWPEQMLRELFDAAARSAKSIVMLMRKDELKSASELLGKVWPDLKFHGLSRGDPDDPEPDTKIVRAVNAIGPELLVMGGNSPWQESWAHTHRDALDIGAIVLLPQLTPTLLAIGQHAGLAITGAGRSRRKMALQRAVASTIGPAASASAETVGSWLQEARQELSEWSAALHARRPPAALRRLGALPAPQKRHVAVRVQEWSAADMSSSRWIGVSPLARLGPPRPVRVAPAPPLALPPPTQSAPRPSAPLQPRPPEVPDELRSLWSEQPTVSLSLEALQSGDLSIVTGYLVESNGANRQPESVTDGMDSQRPVFHMPGEPHTTDGDAPPRQDEAEPTSSERENRLPSLEAPLAPTTRLRSRDADALAASHVSSESADDLPATRRLRSPSELSGRSESPGMPNTPEQEQVSLAQPSSSSLTGPNDAAQALQKSRRISRRYIVKRAPGHSVRRRRRKRKSGA
jgi:UDP-N-acetyl-D-mannosaminuronic acid transferase (WecB/TagA/CpsF family)